MQYFLYRNGGNGAISVSNGDIATTSSAATNFDATGSIFAAYLGKLYLYSYHRIV